MNEITFLCSRPLEFPETGGELIAKEMLDGLRRDGLRVDIVTLNDVSRAAHRNFLLANVEFAWRLLFRRRAHRVIVENAYLHPWLFAFNFLARLSGRKLVVQVFHWDYPHMAPGLRRSLDRMVTSLFLLPAHEVITLSPTVLRQTQQLVWPRNSRVFQVVPPGCNYAGEDIQAPSPATNELRLLCAANYDRRKGLHYLLQALALLKRESFFPKLRLWLAGSDRGADTYLRELQALAASEGLEGTVSFLGWQDRDRMRELYRQAHIFVLPTLNEGFGMVLVEASLFGLPIVASRVGPIPELVADGSNGMLVPPGDPAALAQAIRRLAREDNLRTQMGQASRQRGQQLAISWEESARRFRKTLEAVT